MEAARHQLDYLNLLAAQYPSIQAASTAIINLSAELYLPKGTEHFISDIHGEYEAFRHVLKNGSGSVRRKIDEVFGDTLSSPEKRSLAALIYYPEEKLSLLASTTTDEATWYRTTLSRLIKVSRVASAKYTRSRVRFFLPRHLADTIEELLYRQETNEAKSEYYHTIIETILATQTAPTLIIAMAELIQRLVIAHLHIIGDIYDRGPSPDLILDDLMNYHTVDIQWGNHDIGWMGAAAGSEACIASVVRQCLRYANTNILETGYGISLLPLASLALENYHHDPCELFQPRPSGDAEFTDQEISLMAQMHKAITIIEFKLEGQIIKRRPYYQMQERLLLEKINYKTGRIALNGVNYPLLDSHFPTIDPLHPYELTDREKQVVEKLKRSFANSKRLQQHVRFLYSKGGMYLAYNGNLLYHGCIAMNPDGSFQTFTVDGEEYTAQTFMDWLERMARQAYFATDDPVRKQAGQDVMWYLWSGPQSPLFGKAKMATFERYFTGNKTAQEEERNAYYNLRDQPETAQKILTEFGLNPETGHIINGHVPVKVSKGESPVKAGGKLLVIDGGFAKAYQKVTGIAGYTLVYNSYGLLLAAHHPFESTQKAIEAEQDIDSDTAVLETPSIRLRVKDMDRGREIDRRLKDLQRLLEAYRTGLIKES